MPKLAEHVVIRHVCTCRTSSSAPAGEADIEHTFTIDDVPFPWCISEKGPLITRGPEDHSLYKVTVEIYARHVHAEGVPILVTDRP